MDAGGTDGREGVLLLGGNCVGDAGNENAGAAGRGYLLGLDSITYIWSAFGPFYWLVV